MMNTKQTKPYEQPAMDVVQLDIHDCLLVGTPVDGGSGGIDPWTPGDGGSGQVEA
ncbi:MAG: hypothetical protein II822_06120 [Prevotella sp.]|nr:hypothetical protein [Prevotella sp.]